MPVIGLVRHAAGISKRVQPVHAARDDVCSASTPVDSIMFRLQSREAAAQPDAQKKQ
jgi:hypothetical protein